MMVDETKFERKVVNRQLRGPREGPTRQLDPEPYGLKGWSELIFDNSAHTPTE